MGDAPETQHDHHTASGADEGLAHPNEGTTMEDTAATPDLGDEELSYEAAREELVQVVAKLESGEASLAESMELWERGEKLAATCQQWLDGARAKVDAARAAHEPQD